jgi:hypothetical protein
MASDAYRRRQTLATRLARFLRAIDAAANHYLWHPGI